MCAISPIPAGLACLEAAGSERQCSPLAERQAIMQHQDRSVPLNWARGTTTFSVMSSANRDAKRVGGRFELGRLLTPLLLPWGIYVVQEEEKNHPEGNYLDGSFPEKPAAFVACEYPLSATTSV